MDFDSAFAFIASLSCIHTSRDVGEAFAALIKGPGYFAVSCGGARETPTGPAWDFYFNTWRVEWLSVYRERDYVRHDPAPILARLTSRPFRWTEISQGRVWSPTQHEHQSWMREIGIVDALCVPIHEPEGNVGLCVSLADHQIENPRERLALEMTSLHAYRRCRELGGRIEASSGKNPLSARELECLRWVVKGKSDKEIGAILGISHTTVHFHIERVKRKLAVKTRTQAAGILVTLGYA